ncbi:chitinase-3-like protein 2 [Diorhabda carinulata]|uniref:chitinase-3-like protein 2 n=1 Tax=Diorhabda carinulata TaxID=1163345 RepID=UPI0025A2A40A|nr:chitinase-3-like protein 2 [Diorhabda carinulata]
MFNEDFYRYTVLSTPNVTYTRTRWYQQRKLSLLVVVLVSPVVLFFILYGVLFGFHRNIVYPKTSTKVNQESIQRALIYSRMYMSNKTVDSIPQFKIHKKLPVDKFKLVCYYTLPSDKNSLKIEDLDPHLCTHINAAFGKIVNNSLYLNNKQIEAVKSLVKLKEVNKDLKILISVGGAGNQDNGFPEMVYNHSNRKSFIKSVVYYVKNMNIDGVDLDWEFPNLDTNDNLQRVHFTQLLQEIRKNINKQTNPYLLTVAVASPITLITNCYDVAYMNDYVDFINMMSYDYHFYSKWTPFTGFNSPLYASDQEIFYFQTENVNYSANLWNHLGMDRSKIIVGLPTYGHTFKLVNVKNNGIYAPAIGYGRLGSLGFVDYFDVCKFLTMNQISPVFDMEVKSPYASKFYEWISFENTQSLTYKAEYIRDQQFGGAMVWSLNSDDYKLNCRIDGRENDKFPLIKSIKNALFAPR